MNSGAVISECGRFRYILSRQWSGYVPAMVFVMLNPSTADAEVDDPTIRRCIRFSELAGFGGIEVVNLFALRATSPAVLKAEGWPVGPRNDTFLRAAFEQAKTYDAPVVCAWGADAARTARAGEVLAMIRALDIEPKCLATTKDGFPRHPLYLRGDCTLQAYRP